MKNRKFRGLRKHGNYWVYGSLIREGENCYIIPDEPVLDKDHNTDVLRVLCLYSAKKEAYARYGKDVPLVEIV